MSSISDGNTGNKMIDSLLGLRLNRTAREDMGAEFIFDFGL